MEIPQKIIQTTNFSIAFETETTEETGKSEGVFRRRVEEVKEQLFTLTIGGVRVSFVAFA